ncbi:MAG: Rossmann fold nucleotide-binding protein, partial [Terracoccus sp.]
MAHREINTSSELLRQLRSGEPLSGLRLQDVDLRDAMPELLVISDLKGVVVLGGVVPPTLIRHL